MYSQQLAGNQYTKALTFYHSRYVNHTYSRATHGKSSNYANALINEALAVCGAPSYRLSRRRWSQAALTFLKLFS